MSQQQMSLRDGILQFEKLQRKANKKLSKQFSQREAGQTKYASIYFTKKEHRDKTDYFK